MKTILGYLVSLWRWFYSHIGKIGELQGRKEAIAGGVAIGFFVGFTPFFGIKTVVAMALAWLLGCNVVAAAIAVTMHDISWPILPFLMMAEYDVGNWFLNSPHFPPQGNHILEHHSLSQLLTLEFWRTFGLPILLGSIVFGVIGAPISYFVTISCLTKLEKKRNARLAAKEKALHQDEAEAEDLHHARTEGIAGAEKKDTEKTDKPDEKSADTGSGI